MHLYCIIGVFQQHSMCLGWEFYDLMKNVFNTMAELSPIEPLHSMKDLST